MAIGPSGWTRTTTSRVKSPACSVDTTEGSGADPGDLSERRNEFGRSSSIAIARAGRGHTRAAGFRYIRSALERMTGFEPVPQGLEGPWATVTPHSLWFGLRVSNPSRHAGNVECFLHTQAEHGPVVLTGP
jgi:hypothetical protein